MAEKNPTIDGHKIHYAYSICCMSTLHQEMRVLKTHT